MVKAKEQLRSVIEYPTGKEKGWRHVVLPEFEQLTEEHFSTKIDAPHGVTHSEIERIGLLDNAFLQRNAASSQNAQQITIVNNLSTAITQVITGKKGHLSLPNTQVIFEKNAHATYIEELNVEHSYGVTEVRVQDDAHATLVLVPNLKNTSVFYHKLRVTLGKNARLMTLPIVTDGNLVRIEVEVLAKDYGSESKILGATVIGGETQSISDTVQYHEVGNTISDLDYRILAFDHAKSHFNGLIKIIKDAHNANAYQKNQNILLSPNARAYTTPQLEIETFDVRCTHGATSGPLDSNQVYYLGSRGIPEKQAQILLIEGFMQPLIDQIDSQARTIVQEHITQAIRKHMNG